MSSCTPARHLGFVWNDEPNKMVCQCGLVLVSGSNKRFDEQSVILIESHHIDIEDGDGNIIRTLVDYTQFSIEGGNNHGSEEAGQESPR